MKKQYIIAIIVLALVLALSACQGTGSQEEESSEDQKFEKANETEDTNKDAGKTEKHSGGAEDHAGEGEAETTEMKLMLSNLADEGSLGELREALSKELKVENVEAFLGLIRDYNETVENKGLLGAFEEVRKPEYDILALSELWASKKGDFIGTNCRLNTFTLLKGDIEINEKNADERLLFLDNDAISSGKLLGEKDAALFRRLFSRVQTESTKDVRVHAEKMRAHFEGIEFSEGARMLSLVIHDTLDGDYLFIGHVGVLIEDGDHYLFVEKLAFDRPYQALKFKTKEECYSYLYNTYKHHRDESSAGPFVMDNAELAVLDEYERD